MTDKVYAHGSVIQMSGMNHVIGVMANAKQAEDAARIINSHDDLVKAAQAALAYNDAVMAVDGTGQFSWGKNLRAALVKAGAA